MLLLFTNEVVVDGVDSLYRIAVKECQKYCQLCFVCGIQNQQGQWSLSPLKYNPDIKFSIHIYWHHMVQIMKEMPNICEYKFGIKAIIANFLCLWKCRLYYVSFVFLMKECVTTTHFITVMNGYAKVVSPQTTLREGNVFTGFCLSTGG